MSKRLKIVFLLTLVVGILVIWQIGTKISVLFSGASELGLESDEIRGPLYISTDPDADKDGISDRDEALYGTDPNNPDTDNDGFLDGEEILSNCNPLNEDFDSCSDSTEVNLTQLAANIVAGGLVEGQLLGNKISGVPIENQINDINNELIDTFIKQFKVVMPQDLILTSNNDKATIDNYINEVRKAINPNISMSPYALQEIIESGTLYWRRSFNTTNPYFEEMYVRYDRAYRNMETIAVPNTWEYHHATLMTAIKHNTRIYELLSNPSQDEISSRIALNALPVVLRNINLSILIFTEKVNRHVQI